MGHRNEVLELRMSASITDPVVLCFCPAASQEIKDQTGNIQQSRLQYKTVEHDQYGICEVNDNIQYISR